MILHGKDLIVSIDGNANMASKSCTLSVSAKSIVKTSPTSGDWEEVQSGKKSWSLTTNHLVKAATAEAPTHVFSHAEIEVTNSMNSGWHVVGNGLYGMAVYITDESSIAEGIHLMEMSQYGQYVRTTVFDKDGTYGSTQDALLNYLNGGTIDGHTIGDNAVIILMTVGEYRMNSDTCGILSTTYHAAMPYMEIGKSPIYGNPTYDTTPLIVVGGKSLTYGYGGISSISNDILFNLINGNVPVQADGIPGQIKMVGKKVAVRMKDEHGSEWVGQAEVTQFKVTGTKGNLMTGSFSFKGNGELQTDSLLDITPQKPTSYVNRIIIDMNQSNPAQMITGDIDGDIFESIMLYAHRYLCKYQGNGEMAMCQLDDINSLLFAGGDAATLDGSQGDVYMGLGRRFFYNIRNAGDKKYVFEISNVFMGGTWKIWEPHYLIAAFKAQATTSYNNTVAGAAGGDYYLRSIVAARNSLTDTPANIFNTAVDTMNDSYFGIVGPEEHAFASLLYLIRYGTTNSRSQCGTGYNGQMVTGFLARMGMTDTNSTTGASAVNVLGLENWWSGGRELMERIAYAHGWAEVTNLDGTIQQVAISGSGKPVIQNMLMQANPLLMMPQGEQADNTNYSTHFCSAIDLQTASGYMCRGYGGEGGGIFSMGVCGTDEQVGTRLRFRGESVTVYDDPQEFLALTAVDPAN